MLLARLALAAVVCAVGAPLAAQTPPQTDPSFDAVLLCHAGLADLDAWLKCYE